MIFSLKEDLSATGTHDGLKVAEEVDLEIIDYQLNSLVQMIEMLGFQQTSRFKKTRYQYHFGQVQVMIDEYESGKNVLEIEGPDEASINQVKGKIPFQK